MESKPREGPGFGIFYARQVNQVEPLWSHKGTAFSIAFRVSMAQKEGRTATLRLHTALAFQTFSKIKPL